MLLSYILGICLPALNSAVPQVMCITDEGPALQEAYVSWYGSTTSSVMPCSQLLPFLDTFEVRIGTRAW